jgi:uncharacterized protein YjbJ (UPF0337 family)
MHWDHFKADWARAKAAIKAQWSKLTDDDVEGLGGWDDLVHKLRELYGLEHEHAKKQVDDFVKKA